MVKGARGVTTTFIVGDGAFKLIHPDQTYRGMTYSDLMGDWWNWVYSADPDHHIDKNIAYLRGNLIGEPSYPAEYELRSGTIEMVNDARTVLDRTGFKGITISTDTAVFFSVYDTNFVVTDQYEGKALENTFECRIAARKEFKLASAMWATYRVWQEADKIWSPALPIVDDPLGEHEINLNSFYAESSPFKLAVSAGNKINKEPNYYLQGPKDYEAVAVGVFLLLTDFKVGRYRLDIGGISSIDYFTRACWDITVTESPKVENIDISKKMSETPYPPDDEQTPTPRKNTQAKRR